MRPTAMRDRLVRGNQDIRFAAEATLRQFRALRRLVAQEWDPAGAFEALVVRGVEEGGASAAPERARDAIAWMRRGWETEHMLRVTEEILLEEDAPWALQWCLPQAYHSARALAAALYRVSGIVGQDASETEIVRRFGDLVEEGRYPARMSALAVGGMREVLCLRLGAGSVWTVMDLDDSDPARAEERALAQVLATTRRIQLRKLRRDEPPLDAAGRPRLRMSGPDWERMGARLGPTTLLNVLYRKRALTGFVDIDLFAFRRDEAREMVGSLADLVGAINSVHEAGLLRSFGEEAYEEVVARAVEGRPAAVAGLRFERLRAALVSA